MKFPFVWRSKLEAELKRLREQVAEASRKTARSKQLAQKRKQAVERISAERARELEWLREVERIAEVRAKELTALPELRRVCEIRAQELESLHKVVETLHSEMSRPGEARPEPAQPGADAAAGERKGGREERVVVYTAVFGGYDDPPVVSSPDPGLTYLFFTDDPRSQVPPPWQARVLAPVAGDPQRDARRVKLLPHEFVAGHDLSVWLDANCQVLDLKADEVRHWLSEADIAAPLHLERRCVYDEADAVLELQLDHPGVVAGQMASYRAAGFPEHQGLHATMFLARRHNTPACRGFSNDWWDQVRTCSKRDQLSFDFVRWIRQVGVKPLPLSYHANPVFHWPGRHKLPSRRVSPGTAPDAKTVAPRQSLRLQLAAHGFAEPFPVFSDDECSRLLAGLERESPDPADWFKEIAVKSRAFYDVAVDSRILPHVKDALGDDVILWGATLVHTMPGSLHRWHCDIECSSPLGRSVSVWIGLRGTQPETSLRLLPGSHRFGVSLQEQAWQKSMRRKDVTDEDVVAWAAERGDSRLPRLASMRDGEALFFDGKLWHCSHNLSPDVTRTSLLLQYASVDAPIRIPQFGWSEWPFRFRETPLPTCLLVSGRDRAGVNHIVPPPMLPGFEEAKRLGTFARSIAPQTERDAAAGWTSDFLLRGFTTVLADFSCHVSILDHGVSPHRPHQHPEEEILLVLGGEVELLLPQLSGQPGGERRPMRPGQFAYYPAGFSHTLTATSREPARYLVLRWNSDPSPESPPLEHGIYSSDPSVAGAPDPDGLVRSVLFKGPTAWTGRLQCHVTTLPPGAGYSPHIDEHDLAIVLLEGEVESLGQRLGSQSLIFCAAGQPHGMKSCGDAPARYLVFEFHGGRIAVRQLRDR